MAAWRSLIFWDLVSELRSSACWIRNLMSASVISSMMRWNLSLVTAPLLSFALVFFTVAITPSATLTSGCSYSLLPFVARKRRYNSQTAISSWYSQRKVCLYVPPLAYETTLPLTLAFSPTYVTVSPSTSLPLNLSTGVTSKTPLRMNFFSGKVPVISAVMALPTTVSGLGLQLSCSGVGVVLQDVINASAKMDKRNGVLL